MRMKKIFNLSTGKLKGESNLQKSEMISFIKDIFYIYDNKLWL